MARRSRDRGPAALAVFVSALWLAVAILAVMAWDKEDANHPVHPGQILWRP